MKTKRCPKCQETKIVTEFYKAKARKDGYYSWCKKCCNKITIKWNKEHPEQCKESQRKHRTEHPEYYKTYFQTENGKAVKARSQFKRKTTFKKCLNDLTAFQWQEIKEKQGFRCAHCGKSEPEIKLTRDHIIPVALGGHNTKSNIQALCQLCNSKKHTAIDSIGFSKLLTENKIMV